MGARRLIDLTEADLHGLLRDMLAELLPEPAVADEYLDRAAEAKLLGISLAKLDQLCRRDVDPLPYRRIGDAKRFERAELRAWFGRQGRQS